MARITAFSFFCLGIFLTAIALKEAWFTLPDGWEAVQDEVIPTVRDTYITKYFKVGLFIALMIWGGVGFWLITRGVSLHTISQSFQILLKNKEGCRSRVQPLIKNWHAFLGWTFLWAMAAFPLVWWYPEWVIVQDVETSGDAAWLQQQHDNLTWLGGDVFRAHSERYNDIQLSVNMQDPPIFLAAFRTPMDTLASLGIEEIPEIIWWFGLNPAFSQFVGHGWFLAWIGILSIGMGAFGLLKGLSGKRRRTLLKKSFYLLAISASLLILSGLIPVLNASKHLRKAKSMALTGEYEKCLKHITSAEKWMPALRFDTSLILQRGRIETLQGKETTPAKIFQVWQLEGLAYGNRAKKILEELNLKREYLPREWQRELSRAWLRVTIDDFNAGKLSQAYQQFGSICELEPVAIQARFHHQLCSLQIGDIKNNRKRRKEIKDLYEPYLRKDKRGVISTSSFILSQGEWNAGNIRASAEARRESKGL